jgi:hypothetical protein
MLFVFNLQIEYVNIVGCGREVAERSKKTTSVPKMKKKNYQHKFLDDVEIPTSIMKKSSKTKPLPQVCRCCRRDGIEVGETLLEKTTPAPLEHRPTKH